MISNLIVAQNDVSAVQILGIAGVLLGLLDGAIVGTALKQDGQVGRPVDPERVRAFRECFDRAAS